MFNNAGQLMHSVKTTDASIEIDLKILNVKGLVVVQIKTDNSVENRKVIVM